MRKFLVVLLLLLNISACSIVSTWVNPQPAVDKNSISVEVQNFIVFYDKVTKFVKHKQTTEEVFTSTEWRKLTNFNMYVNMLILKFQAIIAIDDDIDIDDINYMISISRTAYKDCYSVVRSHWDTFSSDEQQALSVLESQINIIDKQFTQLQEDPTQQQIGQTLSLIAGFLEVSVQMLNLIVL